MVAHPRLHPARHQGRASAGSPRAEVAELGYELVLGNTFHLHLAPGEERIAGRGGLHGFMGWERIADHRLRRLPGLLACPRRRRRRDQGAPRRGRRRGQGRDHRGGVAFQSLLDGSDRFLGPEESMGIQAALGSDIALAFDECTPFHADRDYTARSTERTHRWLDRCLDWHERGGTRAIRPSSGSSRAASTRTCGASRRSGRRRPRSTGSRSAAPSAGRRRRCTGCSASPCPSCRPRRRDTCSGSARSTTSSPASPSASTSSIARSPPGSPGTAWRLRRSPRRRFRIDLAKARYSRGRRPDRRGLPLRGLPPSQPRLSPLPGAVEGADRGPAAHPPQPHLHGAAHRARARGDRGGHVRRILRCDPRRSRALVSVTTAGCCPRSGCGAR